MYKGKQITLHRYFSLFNWGGKKKEKTNAYNTKVGHLESRSWA
jgi:hypothetical protein